MDMRPLRGCFWIMEPTLRLGCLREKKQLYTAAEHGNEDMMRLLVQRGADLLAKGELGQQPLQIAQVKKITAILDESLAQGIDQIGINEHGRIPLAQVIYERIQVSIAHFSY